MKLLQSSKSHYAIVTEVKAITIDPLYEDYQTFERKIRIHTVYGETLELVLYADERNKVAVSVPLEEKDASSSI
jgi:hypothetical protein